MPRILGYDIAITGDTLYGPFTILDGQASSALLTSFPSAGANNIEVQYSIFRNGINRTGIAMISSNGVSAAFAEINVDLTEIGVELTAMVNGANIEIRYTSTSTGFNGSFKFYRKIWS
jgi:hypothetical protein